MIGILEQIGRETLARLSRIATSHIPGLLAAIVILAAAWASALMVRAVLLRIVKGSAVDRFLRRSGFGTLVPGAPVLKASMLVARGSYWAILTGGFLLALSAFDTQLTARLVDTVLLLLPKLIAGAVILVTGLWLSRYLGRSTLVWAINEGIPSARRISQAVKVIVVFVAVVVAADHLDFARNVFLAAFILLVGGITLAGALAFGLAARNRVEHFMVQRESADSDSSDRTWEHV
jgi:hypothetical protein